jgi:ribose-phosphate pyrophosphokinase
VDQNIVEYCLIADALRRKGAGKIIGVIPWFGYSKQDKVFREGEPLSVKVIVNMLTASRVDEILTVDLHNPASVDYFDIPVVNLTAESLFLDYFANMKELVVVSPDKGSLDKSIRLSQKLGLKLASIGKKRNLETGKVKIVDFEGEVRGKDTLIYDDMVATGSTLMEAAKLLKEKKAKSVTVAVTHHLYLPGVHQKLVLEGIDKVVTTDSIRKPDGQTLNNLEVLSISKLLADRIPKMLG